MMLGVNLCSCFIGGAMLVLHGNFFDSIAFLLQYPDFAGHALLMSVCSASGQMFIFYTIETFDAVMFATIMTLRQILSILISVVYYGHAVNAMGVLGMGLVFIALGYKTWDKWQNSSASGGRR